MRDIEFLLGQGKQLFEKRSGLLSLWQEIAENFYPERADFTTVRNLGADFGADLMSSYPVLARRDLGNAFGSMLRPTSKNWKHIRTVDNWEKLGTEAKSWLEMADARMTRAMYNRKSQFVRATKEGDHDFAAFGQTVIQVTLNRNGDGMLYRCHHLRDVTWVEDEDGAPTTVFRKWKPTAAELNKLFPGKIHAEVTRKLEKDPYFEFEVWHCIVPAELYPGDKDFNTPYVSIYLDVANEHKMEEIGLKGQEYVIPRWQTVSGSQYAYSPATITALPDARLIQAMTLVLIEAGEKAVNPPMIATQGALTSGINIYAGGVTWAEAEYDERSGEALKTLAMDHRGIPLGLEMAKDIRMLITECFYLNKITLPQPGNEMTAYEVGQRVQEYIRQAMPLFEPMGSGYNGPMCEITFETMLRAGAFGSVLDMPKELQGMSYEFTFESPLHDAVEREKGQRFLEAKSMLAAAVELDPGAIYTVNATAALRDVLQGIGVPARWMNSEADVARQIDQMKQQQQSAELLAQMQQGADVAATLSKVTPPGGAQTAGAQMV